MTLSYTQTRGIYLPRYRCDVRIEPNLSDGEGYNFTNQIYVDHPWSHQGFYDLDDQGGVDLKGVPPNAHVGVSVIYTNEDETEYDMLTERVGLDLQVTVNEDGSMLLEGGSGEIIRIEPSEIEMNVITAVLTPEDVPISRNRTINVAESEMSIHPSYSEPLSLGHIWNREEDGSIGPYDIPWDRPEEDDDTMVEIWWKPGVCQHPGNEKILLFCGSMSVTSEVNHPLSDGLVEIDDRNGSDPFVEDHIYTYTADGKEYFYRDGDCYAVAARLDPDGMMTLTGVQHLMTYKSIGVADESTALTGGEQIIPLGESGNFLALWHFQDNNDRIVGIYGQVISVDAEGQITDSGDPFYVEKGQVGTGGVNPTEPIDSHGQIGAFSVDASHAIVGWNYTDHYLYNSASPGFASIWFDGLEMDSVDLTVLYDSSPYPNGMWNEGSFNKFHAHVLSPTRGIWVYPGLDHSGEAVVFDIDIDNQTVSHTFTRFAPTSSFTYWEQTGNYSFDYVQDALEHSSVAFMNEKWFVTLSMTTDTLDLDAAEPDKITTPETLANLFNTMRLCRINDDGTVEEVWSKHTTYAALQSLVALDERTLVVLHDVESVVTVGGTTTAQGYVTVYDVDTTNQVITEQRHLGAIPNFTVSVS